MIKHLLIFLFLYATVTSNAQVISTIAGNGTVGYSGDGGLATAAQLNYNSGISMDAAGNLYIADLYNHTIRKVDQNGIITTIAGTGAAGYNGDGILATTATLNDPEGVFADNSGNIYIADLHNSRIRKIDQSGIISTIAGTGNSSYNGDGVLATNADLNWPTCIVIDNTGNLYIADNYNYRVRKVNTSGIITTIAGTGTYGSNGDGGPATAAEIGRISGIALDNNGNLYIGDFDHSRVRMVDANGIITTFAGNGSTGYSGDGGPATQAQIGTLWSAIQSDNFGNIYISDHSNNCVRKVDGNGIITTIAGNGTPGYSGDGGLATQALLQAPNFQIIDGQGNIYISDQENNVIRKITNPPVYTANSFSIYVQSTCTTARFTVHVNNYTSGLSVRTYFGDGSSSTQNVATNGNTAFDHNYLSSGVYSVKQVLYLNSNAVDSFQFSYQHTFCNNLPVQFYVDLNNNCINDNSDLLMQKPLLVEVDSNNTIIDTISCTGGFNYTAYGNAGDIYDFKIISLPGDMIATCPVTGVITDTLQTGTNSLKYAGLNCTGSNNFDLGVYVNSTAGPHAFETNIYLENLYCTPQNAVLTVNYDPSYPAFMGATNPPPTSQSSGIATWNLNGLSNAGDEHVYMYLENGTHATGDIINTTYTITPTTGDMNPVNNSIIVCDTVDGSYDPNAIYVKPSGCVPTGTNLEYTITFENMGNGPAENIYVMDTLPAGLDIKSMRIKFASHNMLVNKITNGNQTILKFDFPNIMLPDSSDHAGRHGMLVYTIDANSNLPFGTTMNHDASIYFDFNLPVLTNNAHTGICWPANTSSTPAKNDIQLYPNPATNELSIKTTGTYRSYTVSNSIGQLMIEDDITGKEARINIQHLSSGVYFISLKGGNGLEVQKFTKQ